MRPANREILLPAHLLERFEARIAMIPFHACWEWIGAKLPKGYGTYAYAAGGSRLAHRISFTIHKGPIPTGLVIDHLCKNRGCVNPEHLEAVTDPENNLRSGSISGVNARRTECKRGHRFTEANTYIRTTRKEGGRTCRKCRALDQMTRRKGLGL